MVTSGSLSAISTAFSIFFKEFEETRVLFTKLKMEGGISTNHSSRYCLHTELCTGPRAFLNFWWGRYESSQHFPIGGYESITLKELHRFLQFEIYYKHGA